MPELSKEQMFEALSNAGKLYDAYLKLQEICSAYEPEIVEDYARDMSHPLSLSVKEKSDAVLE